MKEVSSRPETMTMHSVGPSQRNRGNRYMNENNPYVPASYATVRERTRSPGIDVYSEKDMAPVRGKKKGKFLRHLQTGEQSSNIQDTRFQSPSDRSMDEGQNYATGVLGKYM